MNTNERKKLMQQVMWLGLLCLVAGCAAPQKKVSLVPSATSGRFLGGIHRVVRGQTLWRISRMYGVDVEDLAAANHIGEGSKLEVGQTLRIPGATTAIQTATFAPGEDFIWPLKGKVVLGFNQSSQNKVNRGLDISPGRSSDVVASRSGTVVFYNDDFLDLGKTIIIRHPDGFWTVYGRNQEAYVKIGDIISQGAMIAKAGASGRDKNIYLHFEIRRGSHPQNPLFFLP